VEKEMRTPVSLIVMVVVAVMLCVASPVWAMRCSGRIVSVGDTRFDVLSKCGNPSFVDQREEERFGFSGRYSYLYDPLERRFIQPWIVDRVLVEEWIYNFGPHTLIYYLKFDNGILESIKTGGHGY
jgi:hypothetical protein